MAEPTKAELVAEVASISGQSREAVGSVLDSFVDLVNAHVARGDVVPVHGLGKFERVSTAAREGVNPATGEHLTIAASHRPRFRASARLKRSAKEGVS